MAALRLLSPGEGAENGGPDHVMPLQGGNDVGPLLLKKGLHGWCCFCSTTPNVLFRLKFCVFAKCRRHFGERIEPQTTRWVVLGTII